MPRFVLVICSMLGMVALSSAQVPVQPTTKAFTHVSVVTMEDTNQVLADQTVVVRGNRIVTLGPAAKTPVPAGAVRIDGQGKFLIPGLADMHAHVGMRVLLVSTDYKPPTESEALHEVESDLFLYAANGVTTVRSVNYREDEYDPNQAVLRARALATAGRLWSPRIYAAGKWRKDEKRSIADNLIAYQAAGYDFIKLHEQGGESGESLDSLLATAHLLGIPVMGHVGNYGDSVMHALNAHYASIEHLTGYPGGGIGSDGVTADTVRLPALIAATARSGVWNCPTQVMYELWDSSSDTWPEGRFTAFGTMPTGHLWGGNERSKADSTTLRWSIWRHRIIKGLQDAGAGLLLGTDAPIVVPGFAVHRELQALVRSGLTPYQALATGTRNVAAYFGTLRDVGTVTPGKRADLVLLDGNPLEDVTHTMHPAGVMIGGRWLARTEIDRRLNQIAGEMDARRLKKKRKNP